MSGQGGSGPETERGAGRGPGGAATDDEAVAPNRRPPRPEPERSPSGGDGWRPFVRDLLTSVLAVLIVGAYLFAVSGVWPPLVAVESGSMVPHMQKNDLVFVMEETRFPGPDAAYGVVTARAAEGGDYRKFQRPGDVIVYQPDGRTDTTPIIHRAMFWVEEGENWYGKAEAANTFGARSCEAMPNCPAPHAGFVTKGDANPNYDQVGPTVLSEPVKPSWIVGTAEVRVPGLGWLRLRS